MSTVVDAYKRNNWAIFEQFFALAGGRCVLCLEPVRGLPICTYCTQALPWRVRGRLPERIGIECFASFRYAFPIIEFIGRAKFSGDCGLANLLGRLMVGQNLPEISQQFDSVCAVPLPYGRAVRRGFNQALEIARPVAAALELPLLCDEPSRRPEIVVKTQRGLGRRARQDNVHHAFIASEKIIGQRLLLIDDVCTTGATLRNAGQALLVGGAKSVVCWAAAVVE